MEDTIWTRRPDPDVAACSFYRDPIIVTVNSSVDGLNFEIKVVRCG